MMSSSSSAEVAKGRVRNFRREDEEQGQDLEDDQLDAEADEFDDDGQ